MYRSRKRSTRSNIKGPNSALTQFLQEEGISAEAIRRKWLEQQEKNLGKDSSGELSSLNSPQASQDKKATTDEPQITNDIKDLATSSSSSDDDNGDEASERSIDRIARTRSTTRDSDEEEYDADEVQKSPVAKRRLRSGTDGEYRKEIIRNRRKKRKKAANLLDKKIETVSTLQNLCLSAISHNITQWEEENTYGDKSLYAQLREKLGGISTGNLKRLANALSKNRALNDETLQLFLKTDLTDLIFCDCSKISFDGYKTLAAFSPHLRKLSLQMCGQLNNEALLYISEKLPELHSICLDGPFLISEDTWKSFFQNMKGRLREFHISNTHRFTNDSLESLLINCHEDLVSLGLSRLDAVSDYGLLPRYLKNKDFHTLKIEYPYNEEHVKDTIVVDILRNVGRSLKTLVLRECIELTDKMIIDGMSTYLRGENNVNSKLESLELESLDQITSDSLIYLFSQISFPCLRRCSLSRCLAIDDDAIMELLENPARDSLEYLNLNSLNKLTKKPFGSVRCPRLNYIDLGFVRSVDDEVIQQLGTQNLKLKLMEVFGDNLVTEKANVRRGLILVGRQSDSI